MEDEIRKILKKSSIYNNGTVFYYSENLFLNVYTIVVLPSVTLLYRLKVVYKV